MTDHRVTVHDVDRGLIFTPSNCPFLIFDPLHYRADGTCKCDCKREQARLIREYDYTPDHFKEARHA